MNKQWAIRRNRLACWIMLPVNIVTLALVYPVLMVDIVLTWLVNVCLRTGRRCALEVLEEVAWKSVMERAEVTDQWGRAVSVEISEEIQEVEANAAD